MSDKISKDDPNLNSECTLRCDNHLSVLSSKLRNLFDQKKFVDVTLVAEGQYIKAHRIMLIAFSSYFEEHFSNQPGETALKEVALQGVRADHIKALVQYMYTGAVTIARDELPLLLKTAKFLKMEGFDMAAQENDMSINIHTPGHPEPNNIWGTNDELVIKKETEYHRTETVGSSDENYPRFETPPTLMKIKEELVDIGDQQSQEGDYAEVMVLGSVGILNQLPVPISFKRRYSDDVEEEGANGTGKKEEMIEPRDRTMEQHQITDTEYDEKSEFSEHSSLDDGDNISAISDSSDEGTSPSSKVNPSHILENQGVIPLKKKKISTVVKTVPERPFKCTNNCGVSYKRKGDFSRHVRYECGVEAQFPCPQCGHRFARKWNLRQHLTKMHSIDSSLEGTDTGINPRPLYDFKCDKCNRTYKNKESLLRHVRRECGVEPSVACNRCKFRTAHSSDLKKHLKNVHGLPDGADPGSHQFS